MTLLRNPLAWFAALLAALVAIGYRELYRPLDLGDWARTGR